ncbi:MAG: PKD domain-containing protein [Methylococcaceae bacterium]
MILFAFLRGLLFLSLLSIHSVAFATYTKVSNSGKALPDSATLGTGQNDWACTYDSNTKLIWEVKTTDGGLRDQKWTYTWYDTNSPDGNKGTASGIISCKTIGRCDTEKFTQDVNTQGLCGSKDWQLPDNEQLKSLVYCSNGIYNQSVGGQVGYICPENGTDQKPTIDSGYFPNTTLPNVFWSSSSYAGNSTYAWYVDFIYGGFVSAGYKYSDGQVRLVRIGQSFDPLSAATNAAPTASFTATPTSGNAALTVNLDASASNDSDGNVVLYAWSSSDGQSASGKLASFEFSSAGTPVITLTVTDDKGGKGTAQKTISVSAKPVANKAPLASFSATPQSGSAPLTVNLDASASTDSDGNVALYAWSSSDGQSASGKLASFEFSSAGTPVITLTVTDDKGATHSTQKTISVSVKLVANKAPLASFSATPQSGSAPLTVNLDASASTDSDGNVALYAWSSSDGQSASGKLASFEFSSAGTPVITLTVTDDKGGKGTAQKTIEVKPKPAANQAPVALFGAKLSAAAVPLTVILDASAANDPDGNISSYAWSFSDGRTASGKVVSFDFSKAGPASATLTVTDNQGATASLTLGGDLPAPAAPAPIPIPTPAPTPAPAAGNGEGYIEGHIEDGCSHKALSFADVQVGQRTQQTDKDGNYKLKLPFGDYTVKISSKGYLEDKHSTRIVRDLKPNAIEDFKLLPPGGKALCAKLGQAYSYKAVIVAGSGPYLGGGVANPVWDSTQALTAQAYLALRQQGFAADRIRYLSAAPAAQDVDKDGVEDMSGEATLDNVQAALAWAGEGEMQDVVLYLIGHGYTEQGKGYFLLNRNKTLSSSELKPALDAVQGKISGTLSVIIDACYSGSFIKPLAADKRFVITSTTDDRKAVLSNMGIDSFSNHFWKKVGLDGGQVGAGFAEARQAMSRVTVDEIRKLRQDAQVDADGSGDFNEVDADIIGKKCYGSCKYPDDLAVAPVITGMGPDTDLGGQRNRHLSVQADKVVTKAWVNIQRPDYHYSGNRTALTSFLRVDLSCQGDTCGGDYANFNLNGEYNATFYVQSGEDLATPRTLSLQQSGFNATLNSRKKDALGGCPRMQYYEI